MHLRNKSWVQVVIVFLLASPAWAHAILLEATPAANQVINGSAISIKLRFNSRIDGKRSRFALIGSDGHARPLAIEAQRSADTLTGKAEHLGPGLYTIVWQVLAADGHITRGQVPFRTQ